MRVSLSLALISVPPIVQSLAAQTFYYLPQVVDGPAAAGSLRTAILLTNTDTVQGTVSISLTRDDGSPRPLNFPALGMSSQFSLTLAPGASQILQSDGYSAALVSVTLAIDPGRPTETINTQCSPGGTQPTPPESYWLAAWQYLHGNQNTITNWQIPGSNSFAHKDISSSKTPPFN